MRRWIAAGLCLAVSSPAGAQQLIQLRTPACDTPHADFATLARVLRVELRASDQRELVSSDAPDRIEVRIDDCSHAERVILRVRREGRESSTEVDLHGAHDAVAVRTIALLLVDEWRALAGAEAGGSNEVESDTAQLPAAPQVGPGIGHGLAAPRAWGLAGGLAAPRPWPSAAAQTSAAPTSAAAARPEPSLSVLLTGGFDGSFRLDGPGLVPGGRVSLSLRHESGFVGRLAVSLEGTQGGAAASAVDLLAPSLDLQGGGELVVDQLTLGLSAGARAGFVTASVQEPARTEIAGLVDVAVTVRVRWQFDAVIGAEIESGVGYAVIGYAGTAAVSTLLSWREWWVPLRAAITLRLA